VRVYTAHLHAEKPPVLVREAFAWGALIFGPLWLLRHGAWIQALLSIAILVLIVTAAPPVLRPLLAFGVFLLLGLFGNDLRRWNLSLRHFVLANVVSARNHDEAYVRLLSHRPDLLEELAI
jgi:hypothetical protein